MLRKLLSSLAIFSLLFPSIAMADDALTLGDAYDIPVLYLHHGITATQTSNITTVAPLRNKVEVTIPAMSGAIFEFSHYGYIEQVYASRVAVNTTTNVVTLTGSVIRDVCFNQAKLLISCSNGRIWDKGTELRLVDSAKRFNRFVDINTPNVLNASGALTFSGSGSFTPPTFATTAERDRQLGSSGGDIRLACVTATGACYFRLGGSWSTIGDTGTVNATTTTAGKVEILTPSNLSGGVLTDDSGAPLVLDASGIIRSSSGAINNRNKVVATNNTGYLSGSILGSGTTSASTVLLGNNTWSPISTILATSETDPKFFGDAGSGALTVSADTDLDPDNVYSYSTITINASQTLSVSERNKPLLIRTTGNVTINGAFNLSGSGGAGGAGAATTGAGTAGTAGNSIVSGWTNGSGGGGQRDSNSAGGGGGGSSFDGDGTAGTADGAAAGGTAGTNLSSDRQAFIANLINSGLCGGGGGGGARGATSDTAGGAGGAGGGCSVWFIGGNLTLGASSSINASGKNGGACSPGAGQSGEGGGGGGGNIVMIVSGTIINAGVTVSAAGGSAGGGTCTNGGGGATGKVIIYSLSKGIVIASS